MVQDKHLVNGKLVKTVFRQIVEDKKSMETLLSLFPALKKYSIDDIRFVQINCKFFMKRKESK